MNTVGDSSTAFTGGYPRKDEPVPGTTERTSLEGRKDSVHDASRVSGRKIRASALEAYSLSPAALEMDPKAKAFASLKFRRVNSVTSGLYWSFLV